MSRFGSVLLSLLPDRPRCDLCNHLRDLFYLPDLIFWNLNSKKYRQLDHARSKPNLLSPVSGNQKATSFKVIVLLSSLSQDDIAHGRTTNWPELEINGSIKNLSPSIWKLTHLTALYINDNHLIRIPSEISLLCNLRRLDLSSNKLRLVKTPLKKLQFIHLNAIQISSSWNWRPCQASGTHAQ